MDYSTQKLSGMSRRRFVKTLAGLGVSAGALQHMSADALAKVTDNPKDEVPRLEALRHTNHEAVVEDGAKPEREPVFYSVPRDEWAVTESAHDARDRVGDIIKQKLGVDLQVSVSTRTNGGKQINVYAPADIEEFVETPFVSKQRLTEALPDKMNGVAGRGGPSPEIVEDIPIRVKERGGVTYQAYYDYEYRPVPAGALWRMVDGSNSYCTTGTPVYDDKDGEERLVTVAHCFFFAESSKFWQNDTSGSKDGVGDRYIFSDNPHFDSAIVDPLSFSTKYKFADNSADSYRSGDITGATGKDYIKDKEGGSENFAFQGATTGRTSSTIKEVSNYQFASDYPTDDGDSGGPVHHYGDGSFSRYANITGVLSRKDDNNSSWRWSTIMADIEQQMNVTV